MLVSNISMANTTNYSAPKRRMYNNMSSVSFEGMPALKAMKMPGRKVLDFVKNLKIGETVKKMFNIVKNSKIVQAPIKLAKKVGSAIYNSKLVQAPLNFVKKVGSAIYNSKIVQAPIKLAKKVGSAIYNSKLVQAPINFVKNIFKRPAP